MSEEIYGFSFEFHDEIRAEAHAVEALREDVFVQRMGDILEEYGEIDGFMSCSYKTDRMKIDGYCYDDEFNAFVLIGSYFLDEPDPQKVKIANSEVKRQFNRIVRFLESCLKGGYNRIEISNEAYDLAQLIYECKDDIQSVKLVLVTDGTIQKGPAEIEEIQGIETIRVVWDIERVFNFYKTGEREKIALNFADYCDGPLSCVKKDVENSHYSTYLGFLPGPALADMYARWGTKMLDMNVRVFLSARGGINKGIRKTIIDEPEMFCAYNNGITVFARDVETTSSGNGIGLVKADDFQIINGGQTTASLFHTRRKDKEDLDSITVPMKLIVINDESSIVDMVPRISQFSNTQNKVQLADLAANLYPHPEIQAISKQIMAPDPTGGSQQTYWFYERARGSFEETKNLTARTETQRRKFDALQPKKQKFDKIRLGKVWNTYLRLPHIVSLGGQKNFARFNAWLCEQKEEDWVAFFRKTVALLILWTAVEKNVRKKYQGHTHNIVTYTLSWFFHLTNSQIDLEKIWQKQNIGEPVLEALDDMAEIVNDYIHDTEQNVGEYCKKESCWNGLKEKSCALPSALKDEYISTKGSGSQYDPSLTSETEAIGFCSDKEYQSWFDLAKWLKQRDFLSPKARSQCFNMGRALQRGKEPSMSLSMACKKVWEDAELRGWDLSAVEEVTH